MQTFCRHMATVVILLLLLAGTVASETAAVVAPVTAVKTDKCPVCGMFVSKYPDFLAQVIYTDGSYALFDGTKDMFRYLLNIKKYHPGREQADIAALYVTDFYSMNPIDGRTAWYVVGSDVLGPMGRELISLQQEAEAKEFIKDHAGKVLLRFEEVTPELLQDLE